MSLFDRRWGRGFVPGASRRLTAWALLRSKTSRGVMLAEAMVAAGVIVIVMLGATHALITANRLAAASRVFTGARAIVQRNIDTALTVSFTRASQPPILEPTLAGVQTWDDDGGADNKVQIAVQENGTYVLATGTLTRLVTPVANAEGADIRQVTFRLEYLYAGRTQSVSMTTMRSMDD
ncbi:MAG: hypothetical protein ABMA01_22085 [Chthoniobacteraceae bacterium]